MSCDSSDEGGWVGLRAMGSFQCGLKNRNKQEQGGGLSLPSGSDFNLAA